jgi:hypothetical protein
MPFPKLCAVPARIHGACLLIILCLLAVTANSQAQHERSPYCLKTDARAHADAILMYTPRLHAQLLRNPSLSDFGPLLVDRFQLRLGASFSVIEAVRGARMLSVSRADCQVHSDGERARRLVAAPMEALVVTAYEAQLAAYRDSEAEREQLMQRAQQRLDQKLITVLEFHEVERLAVEVRQRQETTHGTLQRLHAEAIELPNGSLEALALSYMESSRVLQRKDRALRALDPWTMRLMGGAIPAKDDRLDWYGWIELSYSLGGLFRSKWENKFENARNQEIEKAKYELPQRVQLLAQQVNARFAQAESELKIVVRNLSFVESTLHSLGTADIPNVNHARDSLALQRMLLVAEQAYLRALVQTLSPLRSEDHGT